MVLDTQSSFVDYEFLLFDCKSDVFYKRSLNDLLLSVRELIYLENFINSATLFYPYGQSSILNKFINDFLSQKDSSCLISGVSLTSLTNIEFVISILVPKRISLFNFYDTPASKIKFLINPNGTLYLMLDLEVFRTLGLSNCKIVHRIKDESVTVEINLTDINYTKKDSKLYQNLQLSLSKITPTTVFLSSEGSNSLNYGEIKAILEKTSPEITISPCYTQFQHTRVNADPRFGFINSNLKVQNKFDITFLNESLDLLKVYQDTDESRNKRRKFENHKPDLNLKLESLDQNRDILVKIFNTVKKNSTKNDQLVKNMIHELNQKNVHSNLDHFNEEHTPINNVLTFIDNLNLQSLKASNLDVVNGAEHYGLLKMSNGILSKDSVFNLFAQSCDVLLRETGIFIMSIYMLSHKKMCTEPLVQVGSKSPSYVHIVCRRSAHPDELTVLFIKSI